MDSILEHTQDIFRFFGKVSLRRMFSGHGIFHEGIMFGLYYDDALYLKADDVNVEDFTQLGLEQFRYLRQGNYVGLSYYRAPDSVLEDSDEAVRWGRRSYEAAVRAASKQAGKVKTRRRTPPASAP